MYCIFLFELEEKRDYLFAMGIFEKWGRKALEEHIWVVDNQEEKTVGRSKMIIPRC